MDYFDKNKKVLAVLIIGAVMAIIAGVLIAFIAKRPLRAPADIFRPENPKALQTVQGGTREVVQEKIATPSEVATSVSPGVAVPKSVVRIGGDEGAIDRRTFEMKAEGGKYVPPTIVVNDLDVVEIMFTAVDADYDIFIPDFGVLAIAKQGETIKTQFQATPFGEYKFFCKNCAQKVEGTLIVNQK